jgi:hypothetical protein
MRRALALALATLLALAAGCQDAPERPPYQSGNGSPSSPGPSGGGGGGTEDGGADEDSATLDGGVCHELPNTGPIIDQFGVVGEPPVGNGGPITDGTYDLTDARVYGPLGGGPTDISFRGSIRIRTETQEIERVLVRQQPVGPDLEQRVTFQYAPSGSSLVTQQICPPGGQEQHSYTATETTLDITNLITRESFTFTRR